MTDENHEKLGRVDGLVETPTKPSCVPSINAKHYAAFFMPDIKVIFVSQARSIGQ